MTERRLHNEAAEQALLGAVLIGGSVDQAGALEPEDFYFPVHGAIWRAARALHNSGSTVDAITVRGRLSEADMAEVPGGFRYLSELASGLTARSAIRDYAATVRDLATRRRLVADLEAAVERIASPDPDEPLAEAVGDATAALETVDLGSSAATSGSKAAERIVEAMASDRGRPYSTGLRKLDNAMAGGLYPGFLYGVEAMDKAGKTSLVGSISYNLRRRNVPHAYVALEFGSHGIEQRQAARALGINPMRFLLDRGNRNLQRAAARWATEGGDAVTYLDLAGAGFARLRSELATARMERRITGFILDYWQLVGGKESRINTEEHQRNVANWCAGFCKKYGVWGIIVSQLNDDGKGFGSRRGLQMAVEQSYILHREKDQPEAWLEMTATRYTHWVDVGSEGSPALYLEPNGLYFHDIDAPPDRPLIDWTDEKRPHGVREAA